MSGSPAAPTPPLNPAEMQVLIARAGLTLNPGQVADLVLAWRQIVGLLGMIPLDRPLLDDQAFVFRLPAPAAAKLAAEPRIRPPAPQPGQTAPPASKKPAAKTAKKASTHASKRAPATKKAPAPKKTPAGKKAATRKTGRRRR